jgi:hypothetical protein
MEGEARETRLENKNCKPYLAGYKPYLIGYEPYPTGNEPYPAGYEPYPAGYKTRLVQKTANLAQKGLFLANFGVFFPSGKNRCQDTGPVHQSLFKLEIFAVFWSLQGRILAFATPKFEIVNRLSGAIPALRSVSRPPPFPCSPPEQAALDLDGIVRFVPRLVSQRRPAGTVFSRRMRQRASS